MIAGHQFRPGLHADTCACGMTWPRLACATFADVGELGWAHTATLNVFEYQQIDYERERIWVLVKESAT